jgi:uncharacterized membrane protein YfcA
MTPIATYTLLCCLGLSAGVLSGLFGIGGGVVIVMGLVALGMDQKTATGTSLAALIPPVGLLACLEYYRRGEMKLSWAAVIAVTLALGALGGAKLTAPMSPVLLKKLFGGFLIALGIKNILG